MSDEPRDCPACDGKGYRLCDDYECHPGCRDAKCKACDGTGRMTEHIPTEEGKP